MSLSTTSRYTTTQDPVSGEIIAVRKKSLPYRTTIYVSKEGDTFETLSTRIYRDPLQYWRIADLNPQVKYPDVIPVGTSIRLPS